MERSRPQVTTAARVQLGGKARGLRSRLETQDLVQSAYHDALRSLPRFRYRGLGSFQRWLKAILLNKVRRRLASFRALRRDARKELPLEGIEGPATREDTPLVRLAGQEDRVRLAAELAGLPERHRRVILLRYFEELSWREVGERLGASEEASQMLCRRALQKLRDALLEHR